MSRAALPWPPRGLNREQAAAYVGVSATTLDKLIEAGKMPRPVKIGGRRVFDRTELDSAFDALHRDGEDDRNDWDA
ncbi:MAG: helix-turn-helix transcriptional regulator [Hyphomonadaceae bacterium]